MYGEAIRSSLGDTKVGEKTGRDSGSQGSSAVWEVGGIRCTEATLSLPDRIANSFTIQ